MKRTVEELKILIVEKLVEMPGAIDVTDLSGLLTDIIDSLNPDEFFEFVETFKFAEELLSFDAVTGKVGAGTTVITNGQLIQTTGATTSNSEICTSWAYLSMYKEPEISTSVLLPSSDSFAYEFGFSYDATHYIKFYLSSTKGTFEVKGHNGTNSFSEDTLIEYGADEIINKLTIRLDNLRNPHFYINDVEFVLETSYVFNTPGYPYWSIKTLSEFAVVALSDYFRAKWLV